ncbi:phosphoglucomutase [Geobacillus sp. LEMMY01]|uniref:phosphoglucomutase n=1 Tax=Geobacillus sp. LEMMY01 TaxID=1954237 RepID=UPI0009AE39F1|nr:phosphoglucomutase [Geobacillus sp. LEMMY01]OPX04966.1 phosphoglucomutase [Geobacillus sp. LEMMY01]
MAYPQQIDRFSTKLNKKLDGNRYVIEEEVIPINGVYEGELKHDNVVKDTIRVYTGSKMTGNRIDQFVLSVPLERPWRMSIKIFADVPKLYVSYETPGDTVEADDLNVLQDAITATQTELERYKADGVIDGGTFVRG